MLSFTCQCSVPAAIRSIPLGVQILQCLAREQLHWPSSSPDWFFPKQTRVSRASTTPFTACSPWSKLLTPASSSCSRRRWLQDSTSSSSPVKPPPRPRRHREWPDVVLPRPSPGEAASILPSEHAGRRRPRQAPAGAPPAGGLLRLLDPASSRPRAAALASLHRRQAPAGAPQARSPPRRKPPPLAMDSPTPAATPRRWRCRRPRLCVKMMDRTAPCSCTPSHPRRRTPWHSTWYISCISVRLGLLRSG